MGIVGKRGRSASRALEVRRRLEPDERRQEILDAAERVLRRMGVRARVDDVVREARVAQGTFYVYFESWDELILALRKGLFEEFAWQYPQVHGAPQNGDWLSLIEKLAEAIVEFTIELEGLHDAIFHTGISPPKGVEVPHAETMLAEILRKGSDAKALSVADPEATGRLVFAVIHETADAILEGQSRKRAMAVLKDFLRRALAR
jgi:AcrR family transcriptional regulator